MDLAGCRLAAPSHLPLAPGRAATLLGPLVATRPSAAARVLAAKPTPRRLVGRPQQHRRRAVLPSLLSFFLVTTSDTAPIPNPVAPPPSLADTTTPLLAPDLAGFTPPRAHLGGQRRGPGPMVVSSRAAALRCQELSRHLVRRPPLPANSLQRGPVHIHPQRLACSSANDGMQYGVQPHAVPRTSHAPQQPLAAKRLGEDCIPHLHPLCCRILC